MKLKKALVAIALSSVIAPNVWATNGYAPHGIGQKAKGMGGAGVAFPQDSLAGGINPAGMAFVGNRLDIGAEIFRPVRDATLTGTDSNPMVPPNPDGFSDGSFDGSDRELFLIPEFGYNRVLNDRMTLGVSVFGNGGMNTDYAGGIPIFNAGGTNDTGIDLAQVFIVPTFTYKLNEDNALGIGLNLAVQSFAARGLQGFSAFAADGDGVNELTNNGHDISYGAGIRVGWAGRVSDRVTLGATYQTKTYMTELDDYADLFAEQGDFDIPENYAIGIAIQATPKLTIAADVMRINYSGVDSVGNSVTNFFGCPILGGGAPNSFCLGGDNGPGFGWDDQTIYKLGLAYQYSPKLTLRAGVNHGDAPISSSETFFNVLAPATVETHLTLGATWQLGDGEELTFSYMHAFEEDIKGTPTPGFGTADISMYQDSFGIAYSWKL
ncbi:MAG: outer membrane protein transport protein [Chromatiales bacterium]|nr:outer membrane protein transport protein [Chromatiales bacterium]